MGFRGIRMGTSRILNNKTMECSMVGQFIWRSKFIWRSRRRLYLFLNLMLYLSPNLTWCILLLVVDIRILLVNIRIRRFKLLEGLFFVFCFLLRYLRYLLVHYVYHSIFLGALDLVY